MLKMRNTVRVVDGKHGQKAVLANALRSSRALGTKAIKETATALGGNMMGSGHNSMVMDALPQGQVLWDLMLSNIVGIDESLNVRFYRDIYQYDAVSGSAIDLMSNMPFSDFTLVGCEEKKRIPVYEAAISQLNLRSMFPEISIDYLVTGAHISTLVYNRTQKRFVDTISWKREDCQIEVLPFNGVDPVIKVQPSKEFQSFMRGQGAMYQRAQKVLKKSVSKIMDMEHAELDPLTTVFLPRKTFSTDLLGTSMYRRILPLYFLEKTLYRGTLVEASRRQRALLHVQMGDDIWEPTPEEMQAVTSLFMQADLDPLGPVIATRQGIQPSEIRCLAGDTLVSTESGLRRIDSLVDNGACLMQKATVPVNLRVKGYDGKLARVSEWHYQGKKRVCRFTTTKGYSIDCTSNHKFLTIGKLGALELCEAGKLKPESLLCISHSGEVGSHNRLDLTWPEAVQRSDNAWVTKPEVMSPSLAYALGMIIREGYINDRGVYVTNTDKHILLEYVRCMRESFGACGHSDLTHAGERVEATYGFRGKNGNKVKLTASVNSVEVVSMLRELGMLPSAELRTGKSPSYAKSVPNCILHADAESKYAFFAAYIDGDGSILRKANASKNAVEIRFFSTSESILKSLQIMLADLGYVSTQYPERLCLNTGHASALYERIKPYLAKTKKHYKACDAVDLHGHGIPASVFMPLLKSRVIGTSKIKGGGGTWFENDSGTPVFVDGGWSTLFRHYNNAASPMSYAKFASGGYAEEMRVIKAVSKTLYTNMLLLFKLRYTFDTVASKKSLGKQRTYDLTMANPKAPMFVANGIVTKNSGGDFWKYTDIIDATGALKLRALGISESFLSSDATYASADVSLSVFIENLRAYRELLTHKIFTTKIFPLIAAVHRFHKKAGEPFSEIDSAELASPSIIQQQLLNDVTRYDIPAVHWRKALRPEADSQYLEVLGTLKDKGLPIPLSMFAMSGGINMDALMQDLEEDKRIRAKIKEIMGPEASSMDQEEASAIEAAIRNQMTNRGPALLNREFATEYTTETPTGKKRYVYRQNVARDKAYDAVARATKELAAGGEHAIQRALARAQDRLGGVPNIISGGRL